jgi:cell division septum initiation protein DivIVA
MSGDVPVDESPEQDTSGAPPSSVAPPQNELRPQLDNDRLIAGLVDPEFPVALRGYDREAVDVYVARVDSYIDRVRAALETSHSPDAAVRQALAVVGEETSAILQRAQQSADHLTQRARDQADAKLAEAEHHLAGARADAKRMVGRAQAEAERIRGEADAQISNLDADVDAIWQERARLVEDVRALAATLQTMADEADARFPAEAEAPAPTALQLVDQPTVEAAPPFKVEYGEEQPTPRPADPERSVAPPDPDSPGPSTPAAQATAEHEAARAEDDAER